MLAQEIGACGGITVLQKWMYPKTTTHQFISVFYQEDQKIDFNFLLPKYLVTVSTESETDRIPENKKPNNK